jgi:hypothetical protein
MVRFGNNRIQAASLVSAWLASVAWDRNASRARIAVEARRC